MEREVLDNIIKERLENINTLQGGFVYDKETAWEKFEHKLEQKRSVSLKIEFKYLMIAASIMVVLIPVSILLILKKLQPTENLSISAHVPAVIQQRTSENSLISSNTVVPDVRVVNSVHVSKKPMTSKIYKINESTKREISIVSKELKVDNIEKLPDSSVVINTNVKEIKNENKGMFDNMPTIHIEELQNGQPIEVNHNRKAEIPGITIDFKSLKTISISDLYQSTKEEKVYFVNQNSPLNIFRFKNFGNNYEDAHEQLNNRNYLLKIKI